MLNLLTALFIITATYALGKPRIQSAIAIAAAVAAPAAFGLVDGLDGLVFSIAGGAFALLLTLPLSFLGHISRADVLVSVALGSSLGTHQYGMVFAAATAFLMVQRLLGIDSPRPAPRTTGSSGGRSSLLALDEQSALVEIEAMKILRKDRKEFEELALSEGCDEVDPGASGATSFPFPWTAKLALSTLAVLMIGTSI